MNALKKIRTHIARPGISRRKSHAWIKIIAREFLYPPIYWYRAHRHHVPGLDIQALIYRLGLRLMIRGKFGIVLSQKLLSSPMDSVRYFEFDFFRRGVLNQSNLKNYLDISSPRLFPALVLQDFPQTKMTLVNPDIKDLEITKELFSACRLDSRCRFLNDPISHLHLIGQSFDMITSMSVIEHIPGGKDVSALKKMWSLLQPNGRLLISVPCAQTAFEEYIDYNEYGLLKPDEDSYVLGQRFYDRMLLQDRFWNITGTPSHMAVYGEKQEGVFFRNRQERLTSDDYPFWWEPYFMGLNYQKYDSIDDLPGIGVVAMEFVK
jgi:predicted SAM-dependent methyltransferase